MNRDLTAQQADLLAMIAAGLSGKQMARLNGVSRDCIEQRAARLRRKLGAHNQPHLVSLAYRTGLLTLEDA